MRTLLALISLAFTPSSLAPEKTVEAAHVVANQSHLSNKGYL